MAADSDGPGENLTTVVTCEGDLGDPEFPIKFNKILNSLHTLLCKDASTRNCLFVCKLEPWNSVRVTLAIPREAALKLRQLASEGSQQLRALGILSVQVEGDQVISLRLSGMLGQESREIILTTGTTDSSTPVENSSSESASVVSGLTRILTGSNTSAINQQSTSSEASTSTEPKVQFKSPNVVCPTDTQVPKPPPPAQSSSPTTNLGHRNYNGPFPFTSMTHAAQAIHNRENTNVERTNVNNHFSQPPPPYPNKANTNQPNVAMSSPLLVNLLQNDGAQIQNKMLPPSINKNLINKKEINNTNSVTVASEINSAKDLIPSTNSAFAQTGVTKYPQNVPMPHLNSQQPQQIRPNLKINQNNNPIQKPLTQMVDSIRPVRPVNMYPRAPFPRQQTPGLNNPPPYPRQRATFTDISMYQQQTFTENHFNSSSSSLDSSNLPIGQPMPNLASLQPIAQPMPHLASLNQTLIDNSLSNITPSLTDLSKTDLDDLLPSLDDLHEESSTNNQQTNQQVPEALTSTGKPRQFLINPLTGELEPMPSESSSSESEDEKDNNVFNDFPSPLHDRSNSIYSDEDTCSTTISRKTDQSDSEATVRSTNSENSNKSTLRLKTKNRDRNRDSPSLKINKKEPEKIKLRLKLEKSEPVSPAYKVDVSFINTQPKRALQNLKPQTTNINNLNEELRVPPLHISLRGRNSVVINTEKKKKYPKLNPDGSIVELKKKKVSDVLKLRKTYSKDESFGKEIPGTSEKRLTELENKLLGNEKIGNEEEESLNFDLKHSQKFLDLKKSSKKSNKINHVDVYREQILLSGGHMMDEIKLHKKLKEEKLNKLNIKKDKLGSKDRLLVGQVGEIRRGSDSEVIKGQKRHADSNGLLHLEKKRRLSQSEAKISTSTVTAESQGVIKSVKLKSSSPEPHLSNEPQTVVGSTNVGTVNTISNKAIIKTSITQQQTIMKTRRDKTTSVKTKESVKAKDLNRDKTYSQNVAEKLANKQLPLPIGEIDMEAKFKQSLLESSDIPRRNKFENKIENKELVPLVEREKSNFSQENLNETDTRQDKTLVENKLETDLRQQRLEEKQSGRSPNSGGQGEDSGIESMDALSEKSPNQPNQSPHCHTDTLSLTETTEMKANKEKLDNFTDITDIEEQLAKLDGLPTLNGDLNHIIKTEPFIETETLIKKLEGKDKDLNENKEHKEILDECCTETKKELKKEIKEEKEIIKNEDGKDLDFDPLPIRRKPPLYTYSNPEKQSRDSESPGPNLSDLDYNSDNSESDPKTKTKTRRKKEENVNSENDLKKGSSKSLLEQLLIEIPTESSEKCAVSPAISEKSVTTSKSSIRTRSSSKLNSPELSEKIKTPKHSPVAKENNSPAISPGAKTSPKTLKIPAKRKRQESESSTQSNVSVDETNTRSKKSRKCSENAVELIKACMGVGVDTGEKMNVSKNLVKDVKKLNDNNKSTSNNNKSVGLLKKSQDLESSDSDEPLIEIAGKVRSKHITRNKLNQNSTKSNISCSNINNKNNTTVPSLNVNANTNVNASNANKNFDEKIGTRRSVRNNSGANNNTNNTNTNVITNKLEVKTRSKNNVSSNSSSSTTTNNQDKTVTSTIIGVANSTIDSDANTRRKTRSTVSDDNKRRRNSRDGK